MATKSTNTFKKKEREESKRRKKIAKEAKKVERKELKGGEKTEMQDDYDPDLAGIVAGPQPRPYDE